MGGFHCLGECQRENLLGIDCGGHGHAISVPFALLPGEHPGTSTHLLTFLTFCLSYFFVPSITLVFFKYSIILEYLLGMLCRDEHVGSQGLIQFCFWVPRDSWEEGTVSSVSIILGCCKGSCEIIYSLRVTLLVLKNSRFCWEYVNLETMDSNVSPSLCRIVNPFF